eukprot:TRINITY_DN34924_c0_g2_i5.p1 TRINITY_DN34924_c0_g2~~TRINITY_DN34924_c0_g2_i5.p1  ORF type:complete len:520 (+),score=41.34 TRINITY_DN34924_c0_g2_i5:183-1742(+)
MMFRRPTCDPLFKLPTIICITIQLLVLYIAEGNNFNNKNNNNYQNNFNFNRRITITIVPDSKSTNHGFELDNSKSPQIQNTNEHQEEGDRSIFLSSQKQEKLVQNRNTADVLVENLPENVNNSIITSQKIEEYLVNDVVYGAQNVHESSYQVDRIEILNNQISYNDGLYQGQNISNEHDQISNSSDNQFQQDDRFAIFQTQSDNFLNTESSFQQNNQQPRKTRLIVFGDNYQDSTDPEIPNLVARINFNGSELDNQPHPIWIDFLQDENQGSVFQTMQIEVIDNGIPFSTARRIPQVLDGNCEAIIDLLQVSLVQCELFFQGVTKQVEMYLQGIQDITQDISESVFFILSGSIDVINSRPEEAYNETLPTQIVDEIASAVDLLIENGANDVKVANIPPLYLTPLILSRQRSRQEDSRILVQNTNQQFKKVFCDSKYLGKVELIDFESLFLEVMNEAAGAGYEIDTPLTLSPKEPITYGDGPFFWIDSIHPDVFGHDLMAQKLRNVLFESIDDGGGSTCM